MVQWCNIPTNLIEIWWGQTQKMVIQELANQRSTKTNRIKKEFFDESKS